MMMSFLIAEGGSNVIMLSWGEYDVEVLIGASLSEPHTSVTALSTCVYLCLLGPTTYCKFQMSAFKFLYFTISDVHADMYFS